MRVVVDTSVVIAALRSKFGASTKVIEFAAGGRFTIVVSPALFLEYEAVISRPEQREAHGRDTKEIDRLLTSLASILAPVQVYFHWRPQLNDADDELVLEAAINGRADCIITHNVRDFPHVLKDFGIQVLRPGDFLKELNR